MVDIENKTDFLFVKRDFWSGLSSIVDIGATMSPHDAWLILRGIKTLPIRMERHCNNAQRVAEYFTCHASLSYLSRYY
ncbi:MAG: PLP-dependent transferase [Cycloclasticus sp.]|nr:PLP-dependent transferase [Cycloclasticus sp.]